MKIVSIYYIINGYINYKRLRKKPIVIGGCERSGTSILLSILSAIRSIFAIEHETWSLCHSHAAGFSSNNPIDIKRLFWRLGREKIPKQCNRWCEKSPANIFYVKEIIEHFSGNVNIIQIVRDGRDVVTSKHPLNLQKNWVSINRWISSVEAGLNYNHIPQVLTIRYEDLVIDYERTIKKICQHIEEKCDGRVINWYENTKIKRSINIRGTKITPLFTDSIRKYKKLNFNNQKILDEFKKNKRATELLKVYKYEL
jgi:hypothetical protein